MKKFVVLFAISCIGWLQLTAQSQSSVEKLEILAKVWGFLKYYYPDTEQVKPDWNAELVKMIGKSEAVSSRQQFHQLLRDWYHGFPDPVIAEQESLPQGDSTCRVFSEQNIRQWGIPADLETAFIKLYRYHIPRPSRYVTNQVGDYIVDYVYNTEVVFDTLPCPSADARLLSLFRYWNVINYFYPHKSRLAWDKVLPAYIPLFIRAADSSAYRYAVQQLIHELKDAHLFYQEEQWNKRYLRRAPFRIDYVEGRYVIGECSDLVTSEYDLKVGDELVMINGKNAKDCERTLMKIVTGSNPASLHRNIAAEMLLGKDSVVQVGFLRDGRRFNRQVKMYPWSIYQQQYRPAKPWWENKGEGIWYVRFCAISKPDTLIQLFRDIHQAKAVIWDMRAYPNYQVTVALAKGLFSDSILYSIDLNGVAAYPGLFVKRNIYARGNAGTENQQYNGPLYVLVDEHTQSLAESVTMLLKMRPNTFTMGRQTAGTTGNITWLNLPGNIAVSYTGVGSGSVHDYFRQGKGITLDFPVQLTITDMRSSPDFILQQALAKAKQLQ